MNVIVILDVLVAALLVATIAYAVVLNRKLNRLRAERSGFEKLLESFTAATTRAEAGVARLRDAADASAVELDSRRDSAVGLRDDLEFLVSRAEKQADRLEALIANGRDHEKPRDGAVADLLRQMQRETGAAPADERTRTPDDMHRDASDHAGLFADADEVTDLAGKPVPDWLASARKIAASGPELR